VISLSRAIDLINTSQAAGASKKGYYTELNNASDLSDYIGRLTLT